MTASFTFDDSNFISMLTKLHSLGLSLKKEDDVTGFLRVQLHTNTEDGSIELKLRLV